MTDSGNTYTQSDKTKLIFTGITAILTGIPFLVYAGFVIKAFIAFCQNPIDPLIILITFGLAFLAYVFLLAAIAACLLGFAAFLVCGILSLCALNEKRTTVPVSVTMLFIFDIIVMSLSGMSLFVFLWHLLIYRDITALTSCAVAGVPFVLALVNLILNRNFVSGIKRNAR